MWITKCGQNLTLTTSKFVLSDLITVVFFKIYLWAFYAFIWTGQCRVDRKALGRERGEGDRQRTVCWRTNHEAIYPIPESTGVNGPIVSTLIYMQKYALFPFYLMEECIYIFHPSSCVLWECPEHLMCTVPFIRHEKPVLSRPSSWHAVIKSWVITVEGWHPSGPSSKCSFLSASLLAQSTH